MRLACLIYRLHLYLHDNRFGFVAVFFAGSDALRYLNISENAF
jgi:hypothetical protein